MPEHNDVLLDSQRMREALTYLSERLFERFRRTVYLVIHGGAVMVLHHELTRRRTNTPDVDYIHRAFVAEWARQGVHDAGERLTTSIRETARAFHLSEDWMNAHADIALPMAQDMYGNLTDPIYNDAIRPTNMQMNTVFKTRGLVLVGVSWSWAVALKLVRYRKDDPDDIAAILSLGSQMRGCNWTVQLLEGWLLNLCSPMGYTRYPPHEIHNTRAKMYDAIKRTKTLPWGQHTSIESKPPKAAPTLVPYSTAQQHMRVAAQQQQPARPVTVHEGGFEHERKLQERKLASRARTRSFSAVSSSALAIPTAPVPPMPRRQMPIPTPSAPSAPTYPPSYVLSRPSRSRHTSVSAPAAAQPASIPLPPSTTSSQAPSRKSSFASIPTPPHSASFTRPTSKPQFVQSLPPGFVPTQWFTRQHHPLHRVL